MESQKKVVNYILQHGTRLSNSELALATEGVPVLKWTNVTSGWKDIMSRPEAEILTMGGLEVL